MSSYIDPDDDPTLHRLEGTQGNEKGGLVIMKKKSNSDFEFKKPATPRTSILGLDKLAASKRKTDTVLSSSKKSRVMSYQDDDDESSSDEDDYNSSSKSHEHKSHKERFVL